VKIRHCGWTGVVAGACLLLPLVFPSSGEARGHGIAYVNQGTGHDSGNDCADQANPCRTIVRGINQAGSSGEIVVAGGYTYTGSIDLGDGQLLLHQNFGGASGPAILDNTGKGQPDITVSSKANGARGFTIRSDTLPVEMHAGAAFIDDVFDTPAFVPEAILIGPDSTSHAIVKDSTFLDPTPNPTSTERQFGVVDESPAPVKIKNNEFKDLFAPIEANTILGFVRIDRNTIKRVHPVSGNLGAAIYVKNAATAVVSRNVVRKGPATDQVAGIILDAEGAAYQNLVDGYGTGIAVDDTTDVPIVSDDAVLVPNAHSTGIQVSDYSAPDPQMDAKLFNVTVWGPGEAVQLQKAQIKVDASILGGQGIKAFYGGDKCKIRHSRGPKAKDTADGCKHFSTTANPKLKADGYHLKGASPMIDAGLDNEVFTHEKDIDGQKRDQAGDCGARHPVKRVDIGADEYQCPKR